MDVGHRNEEPFQVTEVNTVGARIQHSNRCIVLADTSDVDLSGAGLRTAWGYLT